MQKTLHKLRANYESNEDVVVLHKGTKNFWRQRRIVDIYIIKHSKFQILEIVCFLPHFSVEVPRVYLAFSVLACILDEQEIEEKCNARKEYFLRQRKPINNDSILEKVTEDLAVAYLISKIELHSVNEGNGYQICIDSNTNQGDAETKESFTCEKPHNLEPLVIKHNAITS